MGRERGGRSRSGGWSSKLPLVVGSAAAVFVTVVLSPGHFDRHGLAAFVGAATLRRRDEVLRKMCRRAEGFETPFQKRSLAKRFWMSPQAEQYENVKLLGLHRSPVHHSNPVPNPDIDVNRAAALGLPPLSDRIFVVTGASSGIGLFTAELLLRAGSTVIVCGREEWSTMEACETLLHQVPQAKIEAYYFDIGRMVEVREFAEDVLERHPVIHGVLHNAATTAFYKKRLRTFGELNEKIFATNTMAPFLLTSLLMPALRKSGAGRVIFSVSSYMDAPELLDDLQAKQAWSGTRQYVLSKLCDAMLAAEMHERYGDAPRLCFHAVDPGKVDTKLFQQTSPWARGKHAFRYQRTRYDPKTGLGRASPERQTQGRVPSVRTATMSFKALVEDRFQESSGLRLYDTSYAPDAISDPEQRQKLWDELTELTEAQWPVPVPLAGA